MIRMRQVKCSLELAVRGMALMSPAVCCAAQLYYMLKYLDLPRLLWPNQGSEPCRLDTCVCVRSSVELV